MHYFIGIAILFFNLIILYKNSTNGLMLYFIFSLLMPNIQFSNIILTYELFAFIPIFILFFIVRKSIRFNNVYHLLYLYLILILFSSIISMNSYNSNINWISFLGHIRFILEVFMVSQIKVESESFFEKVLLVVIISNIMVSIIQILYPQTVNLFYKLYFRPSLTPLKEAMSIGRFNRAYGTFGTPVKLGGFSLVAFSFFFSKIVMDSYQKKDIIAFLCSLTSGILSLTKTFVLGVPIIIIVSVLLKNNFKTYKQKPIENIKKVFLGVLIIFVGKLLIGKMKELNLPINYYLKYLYKPLAAFSSRYDSSKGILALTKQVIKENLLIGVGLTNIKGEFIGDSSYIVILHDSGLTGLIIFIFIFILLLINIIIQRDFSKIMVFISLLMIGLSQPAFISILGCLIINYCYNNENHQNNMININEYC